MLGGVDDLEVVGHAGHVLNLEGVAHPGRLGTVFGNLVPGNGIGFF